MNVSKLIIDLQKIEEEGGGEHTILTPHFDEGWEEANTIEVDIDEVRIS